MEFRNVRTLGRLTPVLVAVLAAATLVLNIESASAAAATEQDKRLHVIKECHEYTGAAGSFCTVTFSNLGRIKIGSKVIYDQADGIPEGMLDSNVILDAGNGNRAIGRCTLDDTTGVGLCTFSDGIGRFAGFEARVEVTYAGGYDFEWNGTYHFN